MGDYCNSINRGFGGIHFVCNCYLFSVMTVHESINDNVLKYYENWWPESQIGTMENNYHHEKVAKKCHTSTCTIDFPESHEQSHEQMSDMYHWLSTIYNTTI